MPNRNRMGTAWVRQFIRVNYVTVSLGLAMVSLGIG